MKKILAPLLILGFAFGINLMPLERAHAANVAEHQILADVDGDGKDDAVVFFANVGTWHVAKSNGSSFDSPTGPWISGFGVGASKVFAADVTCDGKADAVAYYAQSGTWYVAPSSGTSFTNGDPHFFPYRWLSGSGVGSVYQGLSDQHNSGCHDAIVTFADGTWYEYDSPGTSRWNQAFSGTPIDLQTVPNKRYPGGYGVGASTYFAADVTNDGQADAVAYYGNTGSWYVARYGQNGQYGFPELWIKGHGVGSTKQLIANMGGASGGPTKANAVVYFGNGRWSKAPAIQGYTYNAQTGDWNITGDNRDMAFYIPSAFPLDANARFGLGSDNQIAGDVIGNGLANVGVFFNNTGSWYMDTGGPSRWIYGHGAGTR